MCSRFIMIPKDELNRIIADVKRNLAAGRQANVSAAAPQEAYPKMDVPILVPDNGRLEVAVMRWGYMVSWQKAPVCNTRAETATADERNMWAGSLALRRCVIPSYGFYEPHKNEMATSPKTGRPIKQQYRFNLLGSDILLMAGVYEDGHFSILTTRPNRWMEPVHERMPVVVLPDELDIWLHGDYLSLLQPHSRDDVELIAQKAA